MEGDDGNSAGDMISNLPDSLLIDIMSLASVTTKDAVQMCVFSKRWKNFWASLPDLYFNLDDFKSRDPSRDKEKFVYFVDMVLDSRCYIHHNTDNVHKFMLSCKDLRKKHHYSSIRKWIEYAVRHGVKVLELDVYKCKVFPKGMFTCESLRELNLCLNDLNDLKGSVPCGKINLPHLKKLFLGCRVSDSEMDADVFLKLLSGCPELEYLWLESLCVSNSKADPIPLKNLKRLTYTNCGCTGNNTSDLCLFGDVCCVESILSKFEPVPSLKNATIFLLDDWCPPGRINRSGLSYVENLELCLKNFNPLIYPTLNRLTNLSLYLHNSMYLDDLWEHFPNLEKLTLRQSCQHSCWASNNKLPIKWEHIKSMALNICKKLRKIEVKS